MKFLLAGCLVFFCLAVFPEDGIVSAAKCPIYTSPNFSVRAVSFLTQGQHLSYQPKGNGWGITDLPETAPVWVAACFCKDGVFCSHPVFRTGPTAISESYFFEGNAVGSSYTVIDMAEKGYWLKIRPIPGLAVFFPLECITKSKPDAEKDKKETLNLSKENPYSAEGKLTALEKPVFGTSYLLTLEINHRDIPIAYIDPGKTNPRLWTGRHVVIHGTARWSRESSLPILEAEKIAPAWN